MSEINSSEPPLSDDDQIKEASSTDPSQNHGFWRNSWQVLKTLQARLRFFVLLAIVGIVIGSWSTLNAYWEKWTRPVLGRDEEAAGDVEYFCPMHPYIVRDKPNEKCPICHMDLAKRKKGTDEAEPLPAGTVSRVQLTPYRVVLAGVQTWETNYLPLTKEIVTVGSVEFDETRYRHIAAWQKGRIAKQYVNYTGQNVAEHEPLALIDVRFSPELTVTLDDLVRARKSGDPELERSAMRRLRVWNLDKEQLDELTRNGEVHNQVTIYSPIKGHVTKKFQKEGSYVDEGTPLYDVADLSTVWVEAQVYENEQALMKTGQKVEATALGAAGEPPIGGRVSFVYPHLDEASRTLTVRFEFTHNEKADHGHKLRPGSYATVKIEIPPSEIETVSGAMAQESAKDIALATLASSLLTPTGLSGPTALPSWIGLAERMAANGQGLVLGVPDSAVIDTGSRKIVYREAKPNVFEGMAVRLGPRMTERGGTHAFYPILDGLNAGDKVVTNGSFLIDAETRLNPSAGSIYYGGSGAKGESSSVPVRPSTPIDVGESDNKLIAAQKACPITGNALGSMGTPVKVMLKNQPVLLCCDGCEDRAKQNADRTLAKVKDLKDKAVRENHNHP
jgi:Cu(I)/Ag(I) efflux system membrane fusion protein